MPSIRESEPVPQLVTAHTRVPQPRFPVIDMHNHLGHTFGGGWIDRPLTQLLDQMDQAGVRILVDLDGGWGESILQQHLDAFKYHSPERFFHFGGVDWDRWPEMGSRFPGWAADRIRQQAAWGAQGLKIWKNLGLHVRDEQGTLVPVDDPRLDPIWQQAAELNIPVTIHCADPVAFFQPLDNTNERLEELARHPDWHFPHPPFPIFDTLIHQFERLVLRHPNTTFIGAHVAGYAENLGWVADLLDRAPNLYIDISARTAELGRQPYTTRKFFLDYAKRILFGLDNPVNPDDYALVYRFLESTDEYFPYSLEPIPPQGHWYIYGLYLPEPVLEKVYRSNALAMCTGEKVN
ncbi:MAG: amidohydrolase family protein [Anaerolineales bacterium]|nr:amidohydrolase family protein [Anaerolineales bacterium]